MTFITIEEFISEEMYNNLKEIKQSWKGYLTVTLAKLYLKKCAKCKYFSICSKEIRVIYIAKKGSKEGKFFIENSEYIFECPKGK